MPNDYRKRGTHESAVGFEPSRELDPTPRASPVVHGAVIPPHSELSRGSEFVSGYERRQRLSPVRAGYLVSGYASHGYS